MLYINNTKRKIERMQYIFEYLKEQVLACVESNEEFMSLGKIDGITFWDREVDIVKTKFGRTSIENISAGFKAILVANYLGKTNNTYTLPLHECGPNALEEIFKLGEMYNIYIHLPDYNIPYYESPIQIVGGKLVNNTDELIEEMFDYV